MNFKNEKKKQILIQENSRNILNNFNQNKRNKTYETDENETDENENETVENENEENENEENENLLNNKKSLKFQPIKTFSTISIYAKTLIKTTLTYKKLINQERNLFLIWFIFFILISPLIFRYAMGSNLIIINNKMIYKPTNNATIIIKTNWNECIPCRDVYGVTLYNITIHVNNVTSPDPNAQTPSIALFASQDLVHWYSAYRPKKIQNAYIDNWHHTEFSLFNGTETACLGGVYRNYLVACLNTHDLATTYHLGDKIHQPPFNDLCFQMTGICGIPCVSSAGLVEPTACTNGFIDMNAIALNKTVVEKVDKQYSIWMSGLDWVEWVILITIFFDCFGNVLRYFPVVSGRPTELESARSCVCEGIAVLGCTSPFVSEDEAIFLRSLIGRTATVFHTIGGRHDLSGLYLDTILNERRGKGEANRRHLWLSWIEFITILGRIGADDGYYDDDDNDDNNNDDDYDNDDNNEDEVDNNENNCEWDEDSKRESSINDFLTPDGRKSTNGIAMRTRKTRISIDRQVSAASTHISKAGRTRRESGGIGDGNLRSSRTTLSQIPANIRGRASIVDPNRITQNFERQTNDFASLRVNSSEVVNFDKRLRTNTVVGGRPSFRNHELFSNLVEAKAESKARMSITRKSMVLSPTQPSPLTNGGPKLPNISRRENSHENNNNSNNDNNNNNNDNDSEQQGRIIDPFDAEEDLEFDMADLLPLICFLDGWLEAIKDKEWTYNYRVKREALDSIFNAAPLEVYFQGEDLLLAHNALKKLYLAFIGDVKDEKDHGMPMHPELYEEINWIICRRGLPDWTVLWSLMSRARLRPMSEKAMGNPPNPQCLFETTRVKPGAIVYINPDPDLPPHDSPENWLSARAAPYKVIQFERSIDGTAVKLKPWPEMKRPNGEPYDDRDSTPITVPLQDVSLIEQNRGKAGALNIFKDFLRCKATQWIAEQGITGPVQIFMAIIDARHMLAEPEIFWNDGLPFFARTRSGESAKDYGEEHTGQQCIMVQYPQFFTNVTRDDFLDNKNSAYYTIWQTLRDCAKTITSSGTNAIWEITNPTFSYATTSRIEDTGTSQKYIPRYISVHLPCFVAYGIAKQTEDYIEAVYRWSTGAVELYWSTFFSTQFSHYVLIFIIAMIYSLACFGSSMFWYYIWILFLILASIQATTDKANGRKPLRRPIVSSTIVMNTMYWISNLVSTVWMVIMPIQIAFFNKVPLSQSVSRSIFWGFAAILLRTPPAIMTDRIVNMCRFLSLKTDDWNYSMVLWRSSQLYSCSFAYSTLSIITGTGNAFKAKFFDSDLTMWSSFRVSDAAFATALEKIKKTETIYSWIFWKNVANYLDLCFKSVIASFSMPDILTKWWSLFLFTLQLTCIFVSMNITNNGDFTSIFITLIVCGLNTLLCIDITVLLCPSITLIVGRPARPEYIFAFLGFTVVLTALWKGNTSLNEWEEIIKLTVKF